MFAAGFGDSTLRNLVITGMETHPNFDDISVSSNATFTLWSQTSVLQKQLHLLSLFPILIFFKIAPQPGPRISIRASRTNVSS